MKIKRYFAPDIKQAMRMVREEQGPDAVILSNRNVDGGVEIVAARDFDEESMVSQINGGKPAPAPQQAPQAPSPVSNGEKRMSESQRRAEEVFREALNASRPSSAELPEPREPSRQTVPAPRPTPAPALNAAAPRAIGGFPPSPAAVSGLADANPRQNHPPAFDRPPPAPAAAVQKKNTEDMGWAGAKALQEMQKEIRRMRRSMDVHFSETAWEQASRSSPTRLDLLRRLCDLGFSKRLSMQIATRLGGMEELDLAWQGCRDLLASHLPVAEDHLMEYGGIAALVGPTGVGKTTTVAKLAARFRLKHGPRQIALVTTDTYRIGAHEQLATYGRILDIPVRTAADGEELRHILAGFYDKRLVLIDTAGMGPRDLRLAEQFRVLRQDDIPIKSYLVLSATSQGRAMQEAIAAFAGFAPKACILTKLDEAATLGAALSTLIEQQLPISMFCDGQQVPEDLHPARTHLLLDRCFSEPPEDAEAENPAGPYAYEDWVAHAHV